MSQQTTEALLGMIIALIVVLMLYPSCQRFFEIDSKEGYNNLINTLNGLHTSNNQYANTIVRLKKNRFIVGFEKNADKVYVAIDMKDEKLTMMLVGLATTNLFDALIGVVSPNEINRYVKRPSSCIKDKSCVCFCPDMDDSKLEITCKKNKYYCTNFDFDFPTYIPSKEFYDPVSYKDLIDEFPSFINGFILFNELYDEKIPQPIPVFITKVKNEKLKKTFYFVTLNPDYPKREIFNIKPKDTNNKNGG